MPIKRKSGESRNEFLERCIPIEIGNGKSQDQAVAICISIFEEKQLKAVKRIRSKKKKELNFEKERVYVESAWVDRMMYNTETLELVVRFNDGATYTYTGVSQKDFDDIVDGVEAPLTSGQNEFGSWQEGITPSTGATLYKRIIKKDSGTPGGNFR